MLESLAYAKSLRPHYLHALHVSFDAAEAERMQERWAAYGFDIPLDIVSSPYRELTRPVLQFVEELEERWSHDVVTVVLPEFVVHHWWDQLLHNQSALLLKGRCCSARARS